jgi:hypothetical protein
MSSAPRLALLLCLLATGPAHAQVSVVGPGGLAGVALGLLVGSLAAGLMLMRSDFSTGAKLLLLVPATLLGAALTGLLGLYLGAGADLAWMMYKDADDAWYRRYEKLPLKKAACGGDLPGVQSILRQPLDRDTRTYLAQIISDCATGPDTPPALFLPLIGVLHQQYVQGPEKNGRDKFSHDYCDIVNRLMLGSNIPLLQALKAQHLPLSCQEGKGTLALKELLQGRHHGWNHDDTRGPPQSWRDQDNDLKVLSMLRQEPGLIEQYRSEDDESVLDIVIDDGPAALIVFALQAGVDARHVPHRRDGAAAPASVKWVVRKFHRCPGCGQSQVRPLTDEQVEDIDRMIRPPTPEELNRPGTHKDGGTALSFLPEFEGSPDGGAAFFRQMKALGADVGVASSKGSKQGFLHGIRDVRAPLLAEFKQLSPTEIRRMAYPVVRESGEAGQALMTLAVNDRRWELVDFLCRQGIEACPDHILRALQKEASAGQDALLEAQRRAERMHDLHEALNSPQERARRREIQRRAKLDARH